MNFTADVKRFFGNISVEVKGSNVVIDGLPADFIEKDIYRIWRTNRICEHMFESMSRSRIVFNVFFLPDFYYALQRILVGKRMRCNRRAIEQLIFEIEEKTWLKNLNKTFPRFLKWDKLSNLKWTPEPHQQQWFNFFEQQVQKMNLKGTLLAAAPGTGKAQPLYSKIKIPGGWTTMGEIKVGDVVTTADGTPTEVKGVFPQGERDVYRIHFADGRFTDADINHLWLIYYMRVSKNKVEWTVLNTAELIQMFNHPVHHDRIYIPLCQTEQIKDVDLPMDPYTLGVILGDGGITTNITICKNDEQVFDEVAKSFPEGIFFKERINQSVTTKAINDSKGDGNRYVNILTDLGLFGKKSHEKFIPEQYLNGSTQQRLALLQGLMDTDGTAEVTGGTSFASSSRALADGVQYLVRSLGGIARISLKKPFYTYKGERKDGLTSYIVTIRFKQPNSLFRLERKKERLRSENQYSAGLKLRLVNIEYLGKMKTQCISIEHPSHLYVTDNFIVTHNTFSSMAVNELLDSDVNIYIVPNNSVDDVWDVTHRDVLKNSEGRYWTSHQNKPLKVGYKAYIFHYEALDQAVAFFKANLKVYLQLKNTVTLDECHNFNNINSMRTELFIELCRMLNPINILWMSGTPIKALGSEVIPLLTTIDTYFTEDVRDRFKKIFGMSSTTGLDILSHRLGIISYNIEKDNIRKHKVNTHRVDVRIPNGNDYTLETIRNRMSAYVAERMDYYQKNMNRYIDDYMSGLEHYEKKMKSSEKENYEIYRRYALTLHESYDPYVHKDEPVFCNKFEKTHILPVLDGAVKEKFKNAKSVYKYYHLKVQGEALGRILGRARTQCNIDVALNIKNSVVTNLQTNERDFVSLPDIINQSIKKTLLYTDYVEVVDSVCDQLKNSGYEPLKVYGDTNKDLSNIISVFTKNKKYNPLVATFKSLSTAMPMIMANTIIMLNTPFRDNDYTQTVSRCDRMGQDEDVEVFVVYLDTGNEPNISTRSKDIMEWSKEMVQAIMGKKSNIELAQESFDECLLDSMPAVTVSNKLPAWCQW